MNTELNYESTLPNQFPFYDLGRVERIDDAAFSAEIGEDQMGVAFSLYTADELSPTGMRALLLLILDEGLEKDVYMEVGNIIASKVAAQLNKAMSEPFLITPPLLLQNPAIQRLARMNRLILTDTAYRHIEADKTIPLRVMLIKVEGEMAGNA